MEAEDGVSGYSKATNSAHSLIPDFENPGLQDNNRLPGQHTSYTSAVALSYTNEDNIHCQDPQETSVLQSCQALSLTLLIFGLDSC